MTDTYRVVWKPTDGNSRVREYGDRKEAALAFALSQSKAGPDYYVIQTFKGVDFGRWIYRGGQDTGWDRIDPEDWETWPYNAA